MNDSTEDQVPGGSFGRQRTRRLPHDAAGRRQLADEFETRYSAAARALEREDAASASSTALACVQLATGLGDVRLEGRARVLYGRALAFSGRLRNGLGQLSRAEALLDGEDLATVYIQRSAVLYKWGRPAEALDACRHALTLLPETAAHERARALNNVAVLSLYLGHPQQALAPLVEAERLHRAAARPIQAAQCHANLAMVLARLGDLVGALRAFDEAEQELDALGLPKGQHAVLRAEVLLDAGLWRDVQRELPPVVAELEATEMRTDAAQGLLYLAIAMLRAGQPQAGDVARSARQRFQQLGSRGWAAIAGLVEVKAAWSSRQISEATLAAARRTASTLAATGLRPYEIEARLLVGELAAALGRDRAARRSLHVVAEECARGPLRLRAMGWEAQARLRVLQANRRGALRAADAGLRVIETHRQTLGATELRAGVAAHGVDLAALAMRLALQGGNAVQVLRWAERWRAGVLEPRVVRPPDDPRTAELLAELRGVTLMARDPETGDATRAELVRRMRQLERAIADGVRRQALHAGAARRLGGGGGGGGGGLALDRLRDALGERRLVEYVECDGGLSVVLVDRRRSRVLHLGDIAYVRQVIDATTFALRRLARLPVGAPAARAALRVFQDRLRALSGVLVDPIRRWTGDGDVVVIPTGPLHSVPWQLLYERRSVALAPSAALWLRAVGSEPGGEGVVLVAGAGLRGADDEIDRIRRHYDRCTTLTGAEATVDNVHRTIDGARLVHLAAHGELRRDNPLFSSFRLADGPQTVYDLERLDRAPAAIVLSACNSGLTEVDAGDEVLGLAASLLSLGTATAVATVLPIPDLATVPLMEVFHGKVARGTPPGVALAEATADLDPDDPALAATRAAFVCLGAA
jgi:tetratricopeptide (TPR) repeat protein